MDESITFSNELNQTKPHAGSSQTGSHAGGISAGNQAVKRLWAVENYAGFIYFAEDGRVHYFSTDAATWRTVERDELINVLKLNPERWREALIFSSHFQISE